MKSLNQAKNIDDVPEFSLFKGVLSLVKRTTLFFKEKYLFCHSRGVGVNYLKFTTFNTKG